MIGLPNVTSLYVILCFGISYWILKRYLFAPLSAILEARENEERAAEQAYAESVKRLERAVAVGEDKLSSARRDALRTREDLRSQGLAVLEKRLDEARAEATQAIDKGSREIQTQAAGIVKSLPERAVGLARELAEKVLGRKLAA
ncbi:MAG TPA: ATP synthase F0 subunit B [Thermoanaerobaculia bacterium]|jgi:F-type H+-transporting ATPase subunit b